MPRPPAFLADQTGPPTQNGHIESFNGKFRDKFLNEQWFQTLPQARSEVAIWRQDCHEALPHNSLGLIPPAEFTQRHCSQNQPPPASSNEIK